MKEKVTQIAKYEGRTLSFVINVVGGRQFIRESSPGPFFMQLKKGEVVQVVTTKDGVSTYGAWTNFDELFVKHIADKVGNDLRLGRWK